MKNYIYGRVFLLCSIVLVTSMSLFGQRFTIENGEFLLNGKPFQIIAGEMHYARIPPEYWRDRLLKARAMGLNTVATYVFWNFHEPRLGEFNFDGGADVAGFVKIAQEVGLLVILRPGPYACAEWEFGGYPSWLLKEHDLKVRSGDPRFLKECDLYIRRLGRELVPLLTTHGGPIIMVQVENEYGSFGKDTVYEGAIRDMLRNAGFDVPLFTADGPSQCKNAHLDGVLPAINGDDNPQSIRDTVDKYNGGSGPYFSPEFYPGWLDHWGERHSVSPVDEFIGRYDTLLMKGISVSLYMFHGGTNFGFMNGANHGGHYQPQPTSYDYDAPLDEAGRPTPKYYRFREVIAKYQPGSGKLPDVPQSSPTIEISPITFTESTSVFDNLPDAIHSEEPLSMEDIGQSYGYILYRTKLTSPDSGNLVIKNLRDYGIVLLDGKKVASLDRRNKQNKLALNVTTVPATLDLFIENGGRINYGHEMLDNRKGITESVKFNGKELTGWEIFPFPLEDISSIRFTAKDVGAAPVFYHGTFQLDRPGDTFLDMRGWGKGCVWVNGHNLGRYWYIGPQQTLYLPGVWLKHGENQIVVLELEEHAAFSVRGLKDPILDQLEPDRLKPDVHPQRRGIVRLEAADVVKEQSFVDGDGPQDFMFTPQTGRYVCLQSLSSQRNDPFASIAELYVLDENGKPFPREKWKVFAVDCEELLAEDGHAENAIDDDPETIWHTTWGSSKPPHPHYIVIDIGKLEKIGGFRYLPRSSDAPGKIKDFKFYVRQQPFETVN
jgi:beta-galactosidase